MLKYEKCTYTGTSNCVDIIFYHVITRATWKPVHVACGACPRLELSDFCPNLWFAVPMSFF